MGNITKWFLIIFGALVIVFNAAETALFGASYLPAAFGNPANGISALLAAGYVLLMLDVAFLVWFKVWLSGEQATTQRDVAITLAVVALIGSIMATVTQLATNTTLAAFLLPYRDAIGTIAFFVVVGVTVAHIVGLAVYKYNEPHQKIATKTAKIQGDVIESALTELESRANADKDVLVDILAREFRLDMLNALGFSQDLRRVGKQAVLPAQTQDTAVPYEDDPAATYDDLQALVDDLVRERLAEERTEQSKPERVGNILPRFNLDQLLKEAGLTRLRAVELLKQYGRTTPESAYSGLKFLGKLPKGITLEDFTPLFTELVTDDPDFRQTAVTSSSNGHAENFTHRPGGRTL